MYCKIIFGPTESELMDSFSRGQPTKFGIDNNGVTRILECTAKTITHPYNNGVAKIETTLGLISYNAETRQGYVEAC